VCFACVNWLFIAVSFLLFFFYAVAVSLFLLQGKSIKKVLHLHHIQQAGALEDFFTIMKCFWTTCEASHTTVRVATQVAGFCRSWRFDLLAQNYELLRSSNCLLGCEMVMETRTEFHFSWVYTFSAMLSSLQNWANHDRYRLRHSTPAQLCYHPADCNFFKTITLLNSQ